MLFAIPEKRNITIKEVIIEDPDYRNCAIVLDEIYNEARTYKKNNNLKKLPTIKSVFFNTDNNTLVDFNNKLEQIINVLGNSRERKVIIQLNEFPVLSINAISSPFKKTWLNILSIIVLPLGIIIYLRAIMFRIRLLKNIVKIESISKKIINTLKKQNFI
jgi:lipopolysaccharide export system permease protein